MKNTINFLACLLFTLTAVCVMPAHADDQETQKAVLITGATTGIGRNAAERLAENGYFVYAGARKDQDMAELNAIKNIKAVRLDVTSQDQIDAAVKLIEAEGRGLWGLVNNAGVNVIAPLIDASESDFQFLMDVNVFGVFRVTKAFAPLIIESKGRIVNISSISGTLSGGGYGMYSASKHAVEAMTDSLANEMHRLGVEVIAIEPGNFSSEIGLSRCKRLLSDTNAQPWKYYQDRYEQTLESCRERVEAGVTSEGTPPDAVSAAIETALFTETPRERYLVVPEQKEAGWTINKATREMLTLNAGHEYSYSRDQIVALIDAWWPYVTGLKSLDNKEESDSLDEFVQAWFEQGAQAEADE